MSYFKLSNGAGLDNTFSLWTSAGFTSFDVNININETHNIILIQDNSTLNIYLNNTKLNKRYNQVNTITIPENYQLGIGWFPITNQSAQQRSFIGNISNISYWKKIS